jgi:putative acetyltransferase
MQIRAECPEDATAIQILTDAAFRNVPYSDQTEAKIIEALRTAGALTISLVAVEGGDVVGHVAFSPVSINGVANGWYGLGPVSVKPEQQRGGVGQALIRNGLYRLKSADAAGCVVLGDPAYYSRFGFDYDPQLHYRDAPPEYFRRLTLRGIPPKGEVTYHLGFDAS